MLAQGRESQKKKKAEKVAGHSRPARCGTDVEVDAEGT